PGAWLPLRGWFILARVAAPRAATWCALRSRRRRRNLMKKSSRREFVALGAVAALAAGVKPAFAQSQTKPGPQDVLLVVDLQNCFIPGGSLAVKDGDQVIPVINRLAPAFQHVVLTQDWHTPGHVSFASSHSGKKPFETVSLPYGTQVLWPDHCVQGTEGAQLH